MMEVSLSVCLHNYLHMVSNILTRFGELQLFSRHMLHPIHILVLLEAV